MICKKFKAPICFWSCQNPKIARFTACTYEMLVSRPSPNWPGVFLGIDVNESALLHQSLKARPRARFHVGGSGRLYEFLVEL